jgi:hypothetical protein
MRHPARILGVLFIVGGVLLAAGPIAHMESAPRFGEMPDMGGFFGNFILDSGAMLFGFLFAVGGGVLLYLTGERKAMTIGLASNESNEGE